MLVRISTSTDLVHRVGKNSEDVGVRSTSITHGRQNCCSSTFVHRDVPRLRLSDSDWRADDEIEDRMTLHAHLDHLFECAVLEP